MSAGKKAHTHKKKQKQKRGFLFSPPLPLPAPSISGSFAPIFALPKSEKCLERAENLRKRFLRRLPLLGLAKSIYYHVQQTNTKATLQGIEVYSRSPQEDLFTTQKK